MRDFTPRAYRELLLAARGAGYELISFADFLAAPDDGARRLVLRQDVDRSPRCALRFARLQADLGARGSYYFRAVRASWDEQVIREIAELGHEIGYHYEDLAICGGDAARAREHFEEWLGRLRRLAPVTTICMHGSPLSKWDNRELWRTVDYRSYGVVGEPYLDVDFSRTFYLTDTGRRWDGEAVSVRDRAPSAAPLRLRTTAQLVTAIREGALPASVMMTTHPQRWRRGAAPWLVELVLQSAKNLAKRGLIRARRSL